jgi:hypothetical protein
VTGNTERRLSRAEYQRVTRVTPRRYESFSVSKDGFALRGRVQTPVFWFERNDVGEDDQGRFWRRPYIPTVTLMVDGVPSAFFYLEGTRLDSCTFAYDLTPARLAKAVTAMRKAGLRRHIVPAAEWAIRAMPDVRRPVLERALRTLVRSLRPGSRRS